MKKTAWPPFSELETTMEPTGELHRDIKMDSNEYDSFVSFKSTYGESIEPTSSGYRESFVSPETPLLDEVVESEQDMVLDEEDEKLIELLSKNSSILNIGGEIAPLAVAARQLGHSLTNLSESHESTNLMNYHEEYGNPMFHSFSSKFDGFRISKKSNKETIHFILKNLCDHLKPRAYGTIEVDSGLNIDSTLKSFGFNIIQKNRKSARKILVERAEEGKTAAVSCYGENGDKLATFKCNIAESSRQKIDGLQVYSRLEDQAGLLFPYKRPTDVLFHMGSVSYPIDIIFIGEDSKVKKISRNIQPGSLAVFGCSGVKNVLEISGGLSDLLGIKESNMIFVNNNDNDDTGKLLTRAESLGIERCIVKRSSTLKPGVYSFGKNNIYIAGKDERHTSFIKNASLHSLDSKSIAAFDIDSFISDKDTRLRLFSHLVPNIEDRIYRGIYNESFSINKDSFIDIKLSSLLKKGFYSNLNKEYSLIKTESFTNNFFPNDLIKKVYAAASLGEKIVFVSKEELDDEVLNIIIESSINKMFNKKSSFSIESILIPSWYGTEDSFNALSGKYSGVKVNLYSNKLIKSAGVPVPDDVKNKARQALKYLEASKGMCDEIIANFNKNLSQYEKVKDQQDVIASSKGAYNESCKKTSRITKRMLIAIKNSIKILNEIKDVSSTGEIITAIADSSKKGSDSVKGVFDLINIIDTENFFPECGAKTASAESSLEDLKFVIDRSLDYINSDILGILILSE